MGPATGLGAALAAAAAAAAWLTADVAAEPVLLACDTEDPLEPELWRAFSLECNELLDALERQTLDLEHSDSPKERLRGCCVGLFHQRRQSGPHFGENSSFSFADSASKPLISQRK